MDDSTPYLRHASEHIPKIENGQKTCTLRYKFGRTLQPEQKAEIRNPQNEVTHIVTITNVKQVTVGEVVQSTLSGHKNYNSIEELTTELEKYYGDQGFDKNTELKLIRFSNPYKVVEETPDIQGVV